MATHRAMQTTYSSEFKVTAAGPMSGPYSLVKPSRPFTRAVSMQALLYSRR